MLTREDDVDAHALRRQGWTISAIARHLGHDRKTIRAYLFDGRVAGVRISTAEFEREVGLRCDADIAGAAVRQPLLKRFGHGMSDLGFLRELSVGQLKLSKQAVHAIAEDEDTREGNVMDLKRVGGGMLVPLTTAIAA